MAQLLANDEEAIFSKLLVFRRSIGNAKSVSQRCVEQPEELRSEDQITYSPRALGFNIGINITKLIFSGEVPNIICNNM